MHSLTFGELEITSLVASRFRLDGGAMFGVVPKPLWSHPCPPDEHNRVALAANVLLIRYGSDLTLVDTGCGEYFSAKEQQIYGFSPHSSVRSALSALGIRPEQITRVILTHLHFDHVGGTLIQSGGQTVPLFPNATHLIQRGEWEDAMAARSIMKSSYQPKALSYLKDHGLIRFIEGDTCISSHISTFQISGHTAHHQGIKILATGQTLVYPGELIPTRAHLSPYWNMGYDMSPYKTLTDKRHFCADAHEQNWLVAWDHDPEVAWSYLDLVEGKYTALDVAV
jgi:glyoxylase-like metal-dependent hydrolase (beta-lactamase superfamily II)